MKQQFEQIEALIEARDVRKAEAIIANLLRSEPSQEQYLELLGYRIHVRLIASRVDDALHDLAEIQNANPQRSEHPHMLALVADCHLARFEIATVGFAKKEDLQVAKDLYQQIIDRFPAYDNLAWVYYQKGRAALISGEASSAETAFQKALFSPSKVAPLAACCYERLAFIAFYELRQAPQALIYLQKAIDIFPVKAASTWLIQVYLLRSRVLKDIDLNQAIEAAQEALKIASDDGQNRSLIAETTFALAELLATKVGSETEIIRYLQKFTQNSKAPLGVDVTWSRAYEMLGDAYYARKYYEEAVDAYRNVLLFNPYHPWEETVYYRMARAYYQQEYYAEVVRVLEAFLAEGKNVQDYRIYDLLGNAFFAMGQYEYASQAYEVALRLVPAHIDTQKIQSYYALSQRMKSPL
jgi:tetratricopeptide (TPR) repeat protein